MSHESTNPQTIPNAIYRKMIAFLRSLIFCVFYVKILCDVGTSRGYNYPKPEPPPIQFDEPSTPSTIYLPVIPPIFQDEDPAVPQLPPIPVGTYLPPNLYPPLAVPPDIFNDDDSIVIPSPSPSPPGSLYQVPIPKMKILNMSCVLDNSFRSTIKIEGRSSSQPQPVIDDGSDNCIIPSSANTFVINMESSRRMTNCGVKRCAAGVNTRTNMCVTVRMPTVRGLKLPEDGLVTLQCTPQDSVVSHTKHLKLGPTLVSRARSNSGLVANGGGQQNFESRMILLRKSPGSSNFDQPLQSGSVVNLGEDIVLRATVQDGDGWRYSRMGPVLIRSSNSQRSLPLVQENGCRSPGIRSICPSQPRQISPLDNVLHFRAFLFQDSSRGDDMVLSVRMLGCLNSQDCFQNGVCEGNALVPPLRSKRNTNAVNETFWESQIQFKVQMPTELRSDIESPKEEVFVPKESIAIISLVGVCIVLLVFLLILCLKKN